MNWIELHKDYPLAYKHMEESFNCLYHINTYFDDNNELIKCKMKHPRKRDLYDFFDGVNISITVGMGDLGLFFWSIDYPENKETEIIEEAGGWKRSESETEAFTKAFEILNDRLQGNS